jgi:PqqD family protein of HPr-rel-A system
MRYRADPVDDRCTVAADGVTFIYHRPSGMTHIVAPPMPEIVAALSIRPANAAELLHRLPADWELGSEDIPILQARLEELFAIGLVAPA